MIVARVSVTPFAVPLLRPLVTGAGRVDRREGFIVTVVDEIGGTGVGEASPPYWLGGEDLATTAAVLDEARALAGCSHADLRTVAAAWRVRSPAAACALDTARIDLEARVRGISLARYLRDTVDRRAGAFPDGPGVHPLPRTVPVAALLVADGPEVLAREARAACARGYRTLKMKVGGRTVTDDVARVAAVRGAVGPDVRLRVDANRAWVGEEARAALVALFPFAPDFVEEPLRASDAQGWDRLRDVGVRLALDESVATAADYERLGRRAEVLVLKAARLGGPTATIDVAMRARAQGLRVVVTDAIETATGRALATQLAALLHAPGEAVGLGGAGLLAVRDGAPGGEGTSARPFSVVGCPGLGGGAHGALAS